MIDLSGVTRLLEDRIAGMIEEVDGVVLLDREGSTDKAAERTEKAVMSRTLLELADLFSLCESLVRNEYWVFKERGVDIGIGVWND